MLDHRAHHRLGEIEGAFQVRVQDRVPIVHRHAHAQAVAGHAGVVHENVHPTEVFEDLPSRFLHGRLVGHIDCIGFRRVRANRIDFVRGFLSVAFGATDGRDPRTFVRQTNSNGVTDSAAGPRYDRDLVFKSHRRRW